MSQRHQQWEYCELRQEIAQGVMHRQYILFYFVGEVAEEVTITNRENAIARLGLEGWEMVGTSGSFTKDSSGFRVFFKRPLLEPVDFKAEPGK
ncbi:MAG: hypothetical protein JW966_11140 [Anaerolineae bacterium]|nr:hypothetical protein [Anaerolineae bacterium]